jgi:hypothetical protein
MAAFTRNLSIVIPDKQKVEYRTLESDIKYYKFDNESEKKELVQLKEKLIDLQLIIIDACKKSPFDMAMIHG